MAHGRINGLGRKADKDDVFQIGSVSKTITGLMFARALEEGWFELDDSIAPFLDIKEKHRSKFDTVTFKQVVTHTSGLPNNTLDVLGPTFLAGLGVGMDKKPIGLGTNGSSELADLYALACGVHTSASPLYHVWKGFTQNRPSFCEVAKTWRVQIFECGVRSAWKYFGQTSRNEF